jgi:hypothetical protein
LIDEFIAADIADFQAEICGLPLPEDSIALHPSVFDERVIVADQEQVACFHQLPIGNVGDKVRLVSGNNHRISPEA